MRPANSERDGSARHLKRAGLLAFMLGAIAILLLSLPHRVRPVGGPAQARPGKAAAYANRARWDLPPAPVLPEAPARRGGPMISGTIYDLEGHAIEGADVSASTFELAGNLPMLAGKTRSDSSGRFELRLADGTYQLSASHDGYGPSSAGARTGEEISLLLPPSGTVSGHVYDEHHRPMSSFVISVISAIPGNLPAPAPLWSRRFDGADGADGAFHVDQLPMWAVIIKATAPGHASAYSAPLKVHPGPPQTLDLTLLPGCTLAGQVVDHRGDPVAYVLLDAESRMIAGSASGASVDSGNQVQSDLSGRFVLEHVPLGTVMVRAYDGTHAVTSVIREIKGCTGQPPVQVVMSDGGSLGGTARDGEGHPLPGARLSVAGRAIGVVALTSDEQGRFRFDRLPPGQTRLELHAGTEHALANVAIIEGQVVSRDISLPGRGRGEIRGKVTVKGQPLSNMRLVIGSNQGRQGLDIHHAITGPDGSYRLANLVEGLYLVHVMSSMNSRGVTLPTGGVVTAFLDLTAARPVAEDAAQEPARQATPR